MYCWKAIFSSTLRECITVAHHTCTTRFVHLITERSLWRHPQPRRLNFLPTVFRKPPILSSLFQNLFLQICNNGFYLFSNTFLLIKENTFRLLWWGFLGIISVTFILKGRTRESPAVCGFLSFTIQTEIWKQILHFLIHLDWISYNLNMAEKIQTLVFRFWMLSLKCLATTVRASHYLQALTVQCAFRLLARSDYIMVLPPLGVTHEDLQQAEKKCCSATSEVLWVFCYCLLVLGSFCKNRYNPLFIWRAELVVLKLGNL